MAEEFVKKAVVCPACHNREPMKRECTRCEGDGWLAVPVPLEAAIREACAQERRRQKDKAA